MKPVRRALLIEATPHGVILDCGDGLTCRVSVLEPHLGRVTFLRGALRQPRSWMVVAPGDTDVAWNGRDRLDHAAWPAVDIERPDQLTLKSAKLSVCIHLNPFRLEWRRSDGEVFLTDRPAMAYMFAQNTDRLEHHVARDPADHYYGLGDKTGPLDLHGRRLRTRMVDALGYDPRIGDPLYKHWPFVITRDGRTNTSYGMLYDNMAEAAFDLGSTHDNYHGLFRSYEAEAGDLDYYVFLGPSLQEVTRHFLRLTGGMAMPPRWSLGYAQTAMAIADAHDAQRQMEGFVDRCASENIPVSSFHFGSGYTSIGPKRYVFNWNYDKYPDPPKLMRRMHDAGFKIVANLKPCLLDDHPLYQQALAAGAFVHDSVTGDPVLSQFWDGEGAHIDFTSSGGVAWWEHGLETSVLGSGIDCGWNDNNEYELWDETAACAAGPLSLLRPVQPLLMTRATAEAQRRRTPGQRAFTVTRAGCPGIQRYAQTWSGDNTTTWDTLRWNIRTGLQMSISGMANIGHDIGGFAGPVPDAELLVRWTQSCMLMPRFIMNSWKPDGVYTTPWLHPEVTAHIRSAILMRYRLLPYLYSVMHAAAATGSLVLSPTFCAFEDDPRCFADADTMLLGPFLLAAPAVRPNARMVTAYLPAGPECWFDFYTGDALAAGAEATLAAPIERLPLVVRAGGIIPMADAMTGRMHDEPSRCLLLFPGPGEGNSCFEMVEDDGITVDGPMLLLTCSLSWTPTTVHFQIEAAGDYALQVETYRVTLSPADQRKLTLSSEPGAPRLTTDAHSKVKGS